MMRCTCTSLLPEDLRPTTENAGKIRDSLAVCYGFSATQRSLNSVEFPLKPLKCLLSCTDLPRPPMKFWNSFLTLPLRLNTLWRRLKATGKDLGLMDISANSYSRAHEWNLNGSFNRRGHYALGIWKVITLTSVVELHCNDVLSKLTVSLFLRKLAKHLDIIT